MFNLGSISTGTMRDEDLIPVFFDTLKEHNPDAAEMLHKQFIHVFDMLDLLAQSRFASCDYMAYQSAFEYVLKDWNANHERIALDDDENIIELWIDENDRLPDSMQDDVTWLLNESLFNALNNLCPPFVYFGSHVGDGSDFGFWLDFEGIQEAIEYEELEVIGKGVYTDGNVTLIITGDYENVELFTKSVSLSEV